MAGFDLNAIVKEATASTSASIPKVTVKVAEGQSSKAKAESGVRL